jgi:hypothetical protein
MSVNHLSSNGRSPLAKTSLTMNVDGRRESVVNGMNVLYKDFETFITISATILIVITMELQHYRMNGIIVIRTSLHHHCEPSERSCLILVCR